MTGNFSEERYEEMLGKLFVRFPSFQKVGAGAYKPGIANMEFATQILFGNGIKGLGRLGLGRSGLSDGGRCGGRIGSGGCGALYRLCFAASDNRGGKHQNRAQQCKHSFHGYILHSNLMGLLLIIAICPNKVKHQTRSRKYFPLRPRLFIKKEKKEERKRRNELRKQKREALKQIETVQQK